MRGRESRSASTTSPSPRTRCTRRSARGSSSRTGRRSRRATRTSSVAARDQREPRERVLDRAARPGGGGNSRHRRRRRARPSHPRARRARLGRDPPARDRADRRRASEALLDSRAWPLYGDADPASAGSRLGVVPFNVRGVPHALAAAVLSCGMGIGVRNGCFCAHPYVKAILHVSEGGGARGREEHPRARPIDDPGRRPGELRPLQHDRGHRRTWARPSKQIAQATTSTPGYILDPERGEYTHPALLSRFREPLSLF